MATIIISLTIMCLCSMISSIAKWSWISTDTVPAVEGNLAYYTVTPSPMLTISCMSLLIVILSYVMYLVYGME